MWLGLGSAITSLTMTVFYYLLLLAYEHKFGRDKQFRFIIVFLLAFKFIVTFLPQNQWLTNDATYAFQLIRNIPFMIMGIYMVLKMFQQRDPVFNKIALGVLLSFLFYMPVIFGAAFIPMLGMLMIPQIL